MDRTDVDVLVVGSGPAGSTTARYAAMGGASVMFIERRPEVGVPVRCGEFMPSIEEIKGMFPNYVDEDSLFDIPQELRCLETHGIKLVDPKGKITLLDHEGYTTDRDRFDQYLAKLAVEEGAVLERNCLFKGIENGVAKTSHGDVRYKVIVGADGPGSRVARSLGLPRNQNPYPAVTAQVKGDFEPYLYMFFGDVAPGAYSWIIPKEGQVRPQRGPHSQDGVRQRDGRRRRSRTGHLRQRRRDTARDDRWAHLWKGGGIQHRIRESSGRLRDAVETCAGEASEDRGVQQEARRHVRLQVREEHGHVHEHPRSEEDGQPHTLQAHLPVMKSAIAVM